MATMVRSGRARGLAAGAFATLVLGLSPAAALGAGQIVFTCSNDICTMDPDSPTSVVNLTQTTGFTEQTPAWSPNGARIAYAADYNTNGRDIWTISASPPSGVGGNVATNVSETTDRWEERPVWSPDSTRLSYLAHYFSSAPPNLGNDINVAAQDGTTVPVAIGSTGNSENRSSWSPNGSRIAFDRRGSQNGIFIGNANGSDTPTFLEGSGNALAPAWSPDGTRIATLHTPVGPGPYTVRIINADNSGTYVDLGSSPGGIDDVLWSPDSKRVAWIDGFADTIWVRPADGSAPAHAIPHPAALVPQELAWSPDGTRLAFTDYASSTDPNNFGIWVARADGTQDATLVTNPAIHSVDPFWKPAPFVAPPPPNPPPATRKPATVSLARLGASGPINPFRMSVSITCHVDGYPPSNHPACRGFGDGFTRGQSPAGRRLGDRASKRVRVITGAVRIPAGKTGKLKLRLTRAGRRLLKPGKTVSVRLTIGVRQTGNKTVKKTRTVKLRVPRRR